jgi:uncharacterized protein (TIGR04141 family)
MRLAFYLFDVSVADHAGVFRQSRMTGDDPFVELPVVADAPGLRAFVHLENRNRPAWLDFVSQFCDLSDYDPWNVSNSCVLVQAVEVNGGTRYFALPVGHGFTALDRTKLESDFGLKVTANIVESDRLRGLQARTLGVVTQQKDVSINKPSEVWELGMDPDREIVKSLSGSPTDHEFARHLYGSDSLAVHRELTVEELKPFCTLLFERHTEIAYQEKFPFIDRFRTVTNAAQLNVLDEELNNRVATRSTDGISVFFPISTERAAEALELRCDRGYLVLPEASLAAVYAALDHFDLRGGDLIRSVHLSALDQDGHRIHFEPLNQHLAFEGVINGEFYAFSGGRWYRVDPTFLGQVAEQIATIDVLPAGTLPPCEHEEDEGPYNARVAADATLCLFDKNNFRQGLGGHSQIEVCDLLRQDGTFFCVKKYSGSADLSHLFSQASVSAKLFAEHEQYRQFTANIAAVKWPAPFAVAAPHRSSLLYVLAIICEPERSLPDGLPFFSRVNLLFHAREITRLGFRVAVARIDQEPEPGRPPNQRRRRRQP